MGGRGDRLSMYMMKKSDTCIERFRSSLQSRSTSGERFYS